MHTSSSKNPKPEPQYFHIQEWCDPEKLTLTDRTAVPRTGVPAKSVHECAWTCGMDETKTGWRGEIAMQFDVQVSVAWVVDVAGKGTARTVYINCQSTSVALYELMFLLDCCTLQNPANLQSC